MQGGRAVYRATLALTVHRNTLLEAEREFRETSKWAADERTKSELPFWRALP